MSRTPTLYTIGHSTHPIDDFIELLHRHGVTALCDVRSAPYSRYTPQFKKEALAASCKEAGIAYVYLGRELGAMVTDPRFHEGGRVSYARVAEADFFRAGLTRVREGMKGYRVALMCAERDPTRCHRFLLVTRNLRGEAFDIAHIRADGTLERNAEAERRLLEAAALPGETLFGDERAMVERAYAKLGRGMKVDA